MKQLASVIILLTFLFLLAGQMIVYVACILENRKIIRESIQNGQCSVPELIFSIDKSHESTLIEGNEINWNGHRYDIVKMERKSSITIIHAINDAEEERLVAGLNENYLGFNQDLPISNRSAHLLNDFFKEYLSPYSSEIISGQEKTSSFTYFQCIFTADGFAGNNVPPPKNFIV